MSRPDFTYGTDVCVTIDASKIGTRFAALLDTALTIELEGGRPMVRNDGNPLRAIRIDSVYRRTDSLTVVSTVRWRGPDGEPSSWNALRSTMVFEYAKGWWQLLFLSDLTITRDGFRPGEIQSRTQRPVGPPPIGCKR